MKRFALIRTDRIGDLVLSLPVAEAIKEASPGSYIAFVVSPYNAAIARACTFVDDVIEYEEKADRPGGLVRLTRALRSGAFDAAVFMRPTLRAALAAALAGVPVRVGTAFRFYSLLFTHRVREHRKHAEKHESQFNMGLIASVLGPQRAGHRPRIEIDPASRRFAEGVMRDLGLERRNFALLHPGSGGSARNLPPGGYAWLADYIEGELGMKTVFTSGPGEGPLIERIDSLRGTQSLKVPGPAGLIDLAGLIENAAVFISGSTGPMHIAAAVGTPTLSFFSPVRSTSPRRWAPLTDRGRVLMPPVPECPTCIGEKCEYYDCMDLIERTAVREAARALLKSP